MTCRMLSLSSHKCCYITCSPARHALRRTPGAGDPVSSSQVHLPQAQPRVDLRRPGSLKYNSVLSPQRLLRWSRRFPSHLACNATAQRSRDATRRHPLGHRQSRRKPVGQNLARRLKAKPQIPQPGKSHQPRVATLSNLPSLPLEIH